VRSADPHLPPSGVDLTAFGNQVNELAALPRGTARARSGTYGTNGAAPSRLLNHAINRAMAHDKANATSSPCDGIPQGQQVRPSKSLTLDQAKALLAAAADSRCTPTSWSRC
jgi:hypothetical protein